MTGTRTTPPTTYLHPDGTEEPIGELMERLTLERDEALRTIAEMRGTPDERAEGMKRRARALIERDPVQALANVSAALAQEHVERADDAEAKLAALVSQIESLRGTQWLSKNLGCADAECGKCRPVHALRATLADLSAAAARHDARVKAEALREAADALESHGPSYNSSPNPDDRMDELAVNYAAGFSLAVERIRLEAEKIEKDTATRPPPIADLVEVWTGDLWNPPTPHPPSVLDGLVVTPPSPELLEQIRAAEKEKP